jgi:hypothetical protein
MLWESFLCLVQNPAVLVGMLDQGTDLYVGIVRASSAVTFAQLHAIAWVPPHEGTSLCNYPLSHCSARRSLTQQRNLWVGGYLQLSVLTLVYWCHQRSNVVVISSML